MKRFGGTIPLGPLKKTVDDHVMLVGDAAAQVKPTSGGGIYPGLLCATQCAIVAEEAVQKQQFDGAIPKTLSYEMDKRNRTRTLPGHEIQKNIHQPHR